MGDSIVEGEVETWNLAVGAGMAQDDVVVTISTDKIAVEVNAPASGTLSAQLAEEGDVVAVGQDLFSFTPGAAPEKAAPAAAAAAPAAAAPAAPAAPAAKAAPPPPAKAAPPAPQAAKATGERNTHVVSLESRAPACTRPHATAAVRSGVVVASPRGGNARL